MNWTRTNLEDDILWVPMEEADAEIERLHDNEARALQALADTDKNCRERFSEYRAEIERLREVARKLFIELEGDDQFFDGWLAKQGGGHD